MEDIITSSHEFIRILYQKLWEVRFCLVFRAFLAFCMLHSTRFDCRVATASETSVAYTFVGTEQTTL